MAQCLVSLIYGNKENSREDVKCNKFFTNYSGIRTRSTCEYTATAMHRPLSKIKARVWWCSFILANLPQLDYIIAPNFINLVVISLRYRLRKVYSFWSEHYLIRPAIY